MAADIADRRRLLLAGDAEGNLAKLYSQVENQQNRVGKFDLLFSVGAFLPKGSESAGSAASACVEYLSGKLQAPLDTYFIDSHSAALIQTAPEGKTMCERIYFLGGYGIREIQGLRIAYLSGHYDHVVYGAVQSKGTVDGAACPPFIGAAYTPHAIEGLVRLAQAPNSPPIDVLLTAEWPMRLGDRVEEAERPKHPDGEQLDWHTVGAPPIAELCAALEPRYHVFGTMDIFYQRPPFRTLRCGHVCRCIALGKVGSKGKSRTWVHGLALSSAASMPQMALMQCPDNTTLSPFLSARAPSAMGGTGAAMPLKQLVEEAAQEPKDEGIVIPDQIFLSRLPPHIEERRIEAAFQKIGTIVRIRLARDESVEGRPCRGFGWVTFSSPDEAQAACDLSELLECSGRKISICLSRPRSRGDAELGKRKREVKIAIEPHADCWFCLVNPKVEKHMIVTATTEVYIATARGPINPTHVQVLPVKHAPCFAACPAELQEVLEAHVAAIRRMCHENGQECLVWERWIPMGVTAANHMQIQVVPIDQSRASSVHGVLEAVAKKCLPGAVLRRINSHADVVEHLNDEATMPYIYFELPGENTAKGRLTERFVYACASGGPRIPVNFGRQVACNLLGCGDKVDWRLCKEDRDAEKQLAVSFREQFRPYQPHGK